MLFLGKSTHNIQKQYQLLQKATRTFHTDGVRIQQEDGDVMDENDTLPWFPIHPNEQLCNLVGTWRILQKRGSHRWTSDDLCTAYIANMKLPLLKTYNQHKITNDNTIHYLDLGCGNASVLQMVCWALWDDNNKNYSEIQAFGMEARSEAVQLARRSLSFNIGKETTNDKYKKSVHVIHCDFRDLIHGKSSTNHNNETDDNHFDMAKETKFDLITGTPPYFQVDFNTTIALADDNYDDTLKQKTKEDRKVTSAVIHQGGMPTSIQSAPARCEFRGGIEAYCAAASSVLKENYGYFCVCENWINHQRVLQAALSTKLTIIDIHPFQGKTTKPQPLFAIYVMQKIHSTTTQLQTPKMHSPISIRDECGKWTKEYADVLETMSIPAKHDVNQSPT